MSPVVKHLNFIQTLANLVAVALENRRMAALQLQQERDNRDLELAAQMQRMLVPKDLPGSDRLEAAAWYQPHRQVGGDYYDLIDLGEGRYLACVADVSGKGIAAALLMSNFQATLRASAGRISDLQELVHHLNAQVWDRARGERFITLFTAIIDIPHGRMRFANAGHNHPLLFSAGQAKALHDGSIALGMMPKLPFLRVGEAQLPPDGMLLCYTDGLVEQEDGQGTPFDEQPLIDALRMHATGSPQAVIQGIRDAFENHRAGEPYLDDIAVLACRLRS